MSLSDERIAEKAKVAAHAITTDFAVDTEEKVADVIESAIRTALEESERWIPVTYSDEATWPSRGGRVHVYAAKKGVVNTLDRNWTHWKLPSNLPAPPAQEPK